MVTLGGIFVEGCAPQNATYIPAVNQRNHGLRTESLKLTQRSCWFSRETRGSVPLAASLIDSAIRLGRIRSSLMLQGRTGGTQFPYSWAFVPFKQVRHRDGDRSLRIVRPSGFLGNCALATRQDGDQRAGFTFLLFSKTVRLHFCMGLVMTHVYRKLQEAPSRYFGVGQGLSQQIFKLSEQVTGSSRP